MTDPTLDLAWDSEKEIADTLARLEGQIATWSKLARGTLEEARAGSYALRMESPVSESSWERTTDAAERPDHSPALESGRLASEGASEPRGIAPQHPAGVGIPAASNRGSSPEVVTDDALLASLDPDARTWVLVRRRISNRPLRELIAEFESSRPEKKR